MVSLATTSFRGRWMLFYSPRILFAQPRLVSAHRQERCHVALHVRSPPLNLVQRSANVLCRRAHLRSSRAAKNHLGKVLYGNMYNEIKSGAACNTLVTEYILRKNPRGDAEIDTEESPFLRDNLREKLPSLAERKRRRERRQRHLAASHPAATGMKPPMPPTRPDTGTETRDAAAIMDHDPELPHKAGGVGEGSLAEQGVGPDCKKVMHGASGESRPHQARGASGSRNPTGRQSCYRDESKRQGNWLPRSPDFKKPSCSGLAGSDVGGGEGFNTTESQSRSRSRDRAGDTQSKLRTGDEDSHRGRSGGRRRQEEPGSRPLNGETGPVFAGRSVGERRRRRPEETTENDSRGDGVIAPSPRLAGEVGERRRQQITTSASLKTLSLRDMEERGVGSTSKGVDDALERWVGVERWIRRDVRSPAPVCSPARISYPIRRGAISTKGLTHPR